MGFKGTQESPNHISEAAAGALNPTQFLIFRKLEKKDVFLKETSELHLLLVWSEQETS